MSCNGCKILRKGCSETCSLRQCLTCIDSPEAQQRATLFVTKFFGRAGFAGFINGVSESQRPALFQSLLYEACGRTVNPIYGAVGLLFTGNWPLCQAAVEKVLRGGTLEPVNINHDHHPDLPHYRIETIGASHDKLRRSCNYTGHESGSSSSCVDSELINNLAGVAGRTSISTSPVLSTGVLGDHESYDHQMAVTNNGRTMASPKVEGSRSFSRKRLHKREDGCVQEQKEMEEESEVKMRLPELRMDRNGTCSRSRESDGGDETTKAKGWEWSLYREQGRTIGGGNVDMAAAAAAAAIGKKARIRRSTAAAPPPISAAGKHRDSLFSESGTPFPLAHNGRRIIPAENFRRRPPEYCPPDPTSPPFQTTVTSCSDTTTITTTALLDRRCHVMDNTSALDVNRPPVLLSDPDHCFSSSCSPSANSAGSVSVFTLPDQLTELPDFDHRSPRPQPKLLHLLP